MFELGGYKTVLEGLQNTLIIAIGGFIIGLVLGILLAIMQLLPDNKVTRVVKTVPNCTWGSFGGPLLSYSCWSAGTF